MLDVTPLRRSARILSRVLAAAQALVALGAALLIAWTVNAPSAVGRWAAEAGGFDPAGVAAWQGVALGTLMVGQAALWVAALGAMRGVFRALDWLDPAGASLAARRAARWLWALVAYGVAAPALGSVAASWHYPPGTRELSVALGSAQLSTALAALIAAFLAQAFVLGAQLWDDHRAVI